MSERQLCTKDKPMPPNAPGLWQHPDAEDRGETWDSAADRYYCPNCKLHFVVEVGQ